MTDASALHSPSGPPAEPTSKARLRLWLKLLKASNLVQDTLRRRLRDEFGSTLPRFDVMSALARAPDGLRMTEISAQLRVSNGNVTGIVNRLETEGLARRGPVPGDRRAQLVRLTEAGRTAFTAQAERHERWIDELLAGLDAGQTAHAAELLDRLTEPMDRKDNG